MCKAEILYDILLAFYDARNFWESDLVTLGLAKEFWKRLSLLGRPRKNPNALSQNVAAVQFFPKEHSCHLP